MQRLNNALTGVWVRFSNASKMVSMAFLGAILAGAIGVAWAAGSKVTLVDLNGDYVNAGGGSPTITGPLGSQLAAASVSVALPSDQTIAMSGSSSIVGPVVTTVADGANVALGTTTDAKSTATDATGVTQMQVLKEISAMVQAPPSRAVTNAGTFATQPTPATSGGLSSCYLQATASTNATNCKASAGQVYHIRVVGNGTAIGYLRLYNLSSAPTCSSATGLQDAVPVPQPAGGGGGGFVEDISVGEAFSTGIGFCFTGAIGTTDATNVAATTWQITILYK